EAAATLTALDAEGGRTTDPVRMYMREMGTVELLTRDGDIAIAKRSGGGLNQMLLSLGRFPWAGPLLPEVWELHKAGKKRLAEIVVGFNDGLDDEEPAPPAAAADKDKDKDKDAKSNGKDDDEDGDDEDGDDDDDGESEDTGPTGPDPAEVARRM